MPKMTAGNRLYFYQLLSTRIGTLRQVPLSQVEELLAAEDVLPEDVGATDAQEVMELLGDFVRLTVFKKGRVYVTVQPQEDWDAVLARAATEQDAGEKTAATGARSWKHKKSSKDPKPAKPRHPQAKRTAEAATVEPAAEDDAAAAPVAEAATATMAEAAAATMSTASEVTEGGVAAAAGATGTSDAPTVEATAADDVPTAMDAAAPMGVALATTPEATPTQDTPEGTPADGGPKCLSPEPSIRLTITYDPYEGMDEMLAHNAMAEGVQAQSQAESAADATPAASAIQPVPSATAGPQPATSTPQASDAQPSPSDARQASDGIATAPPTAELSSPAHPTPVRPTSKRSVAEPAGPVRVNPLPPVQLQADLPQDFRAEVSCRLEALERLYALLPTDVDALATLDEDWRAARSAGNVLGSRSLVRFPLRYLRPDGSAPIEATLRRNARPSAAPQGKHWVLASVDDGCEASTLPDVGLDGVPMAQEGCWQLLDPTAPGRADVSPERELAQFAVTGPWEPLLTQLANAAASEPWSLPGRSDPSVLREYLCLAFWRAHRAGLVATAPGGGQAAFNTGLLTSRGQYLCMCLASHEGDIPWRFAGWVVEGDERLAELEPKDAAGESGALPLPEPPALPRTPPTLTTLDLAPEVGSTLGTRFGEDAGDLIERSLRLAWQSPRLLATAYDPQHDDACLLLPLWPEEGTAVEVVISLAPEAAGRWRGCAVLSPAQAYACARSLSREMPPWLAGALG